MSEEGRNIIAKGKINIALNLFMIGVVIFIAALVLQDRIDNRSNPCPCEEMVRENNDLKRLLQIETE